MKLLLGSILVTPTTYVVTSVTAVYSVSSISCVCEVSVYRGSYLGPGFVSSSVSRGYLALYTVWGFEHLSTLRSVSFSNMMSRFDLDTENATGSGESDSSTEDERDTSLGGRRVWDADADAPRRDLSPQSARPRVSAVVPASTALGLQFRSP